MIKRIDINKPEFDWSVTLREEQTVQEYLDDMEFSESLS